MKLLPILGTEISTFSGGCYCPHYFADRSSETDTSERDRARHHLAEHRAHVGEHREGGGVFGRGAQRPRGPTGDEEVDARAHREAGGRLTEGDRPQHHRAGEEAA